MIFFVSNSINLFPSFQHISVEESIQLIRKEQYVEYDCETIKSPKINGASALDPHTGLLLLAQFGVGENQIVVDAATVRIEEYKEVFEDSKITFVGHNLIFDVQWLLKHGIKPSKVYDTMITEQLLHLGEDNKKNPLFGNIDPLLEIDSSKIWTEEEYDMYMYTLDHKFALKSLIWKYEHVNIDKSVRGEIANEGLTERVIKYAAGDVTFLNRIRLKQAKLIATEGLETALKIENASIVPLAYLSFCGAKIDQQKWLKKSEVEAPKIKALEEIVYKDIIDFYEQHKAPDDKGKPCVYRNFIIEGKDEVKREHRICADNDIPINAERNQDIFADKIVYSWIVPYGYYDIKHTFIPYVKRDLQGDLFSGFNTELQANINLKSTTQLIPLLTIFGVKCRTIDKKTKEEKDSFGKNTIALFADKFPIVKHLGDYKQLCKQLDAFGPKFLTGINPVTHCIHPQWHQLGTKTGRLSSSSPINLGLIIVIL